MDDGHSWGCDLSQARDQHREKPSASLMLGAWPREAHWGPGSCDLLPPGSPPVGTTPSLSDTSLTCQSVITLQILLMGMYGCESRTLKKTEYRRNDAFKLWCWRRLLRVPEKSRRPNPSILKEINPEYSLEGLKLQYFGHLMVRADSLKKTLMLGKIKGRRRRGQQRMRWLDDISS